MKVLITGVCGVMGKNLVDYFFQNGITSITGFDITDFEKDNKYNIPFFKGDVNDKELLDKAAEGVDVIVHAAAASPSFSDETISASIIGGTRNLLDIACKKGIKRFVYVSSTSVYGIPKVAPVLETTEVEPYDTYNKSKIAAEKICDEYRKKGIIIPILRPRTFVGPARLGTFAMLFEWARSGKNFPIMGKGSNKYQLLDVEDLCQACYCAVIGRDEDVNDVFNIGAKDFGSIKEDYQAVLDEAGYKKKIISIPALPMKLILGLMYQLGISPLYDRLYKKLTLDYYVCIKKAEKKLGYKPKYSNREALIRNYKWYLENHQSFTSQSGSGNNMPWNQGALKLAKIFF